MATKRKRPDSHSRLSLIRPLATSGIYCRLRPSQFHGVGVFAVRPIPKGTLLFPIPTTPERSISKRRLRRLPDGVQELILDMGVDNGDVVSLYNVDFHHLDMGHYINEARLPSLPNVAKVIKNGVEYFCVLRDIPKDEELLCDYDV